MEFIKSDITLINRGIIAHGVNCQRTMGSGVAKAIKDKWPVVYEEYMKYPKGRENLGKVNFVPVTANIWVANCFTQIYYGRNSNTKYASPIAIRNCMLSVFPFASSNETPVCLPKIGCGLGGLSWKEEVEPIIQEMEDRFKVPTLIYEI
jgi:O-acetyl-ADP-ribose deacetylase (regulator of RNase III)